MAHCNASPTRNRFFFTIWSDFTVFSALCVLRTLAGLLWSRMLLVHLCKNKYLRCSYTVKQWPPQKRRFMTLLSFIQLLMNTINHLWPPQHSVMLCSITRTLPDSKCCCVWLGRSISRQWVFTCIFYSWYFRRKHSSKQCLVQHKPFQT